MISSANRKVRIYITTYRPEELYKNPMNSKHNQSCSDRNYFCAICLNKAGSQIDCGKKLAKSCSICRKHMTCDHKTDSRNEPKNKGKTNTGPDTETHGSYKDYKTKNVQTSRTDLTPDLSLLKEVLTVFQTKKQLDNKNNNKTVIMKDVSVETEGTSKIELKAKLTMSRIMQYSIEENSRGIGNNFKIVNYSQPDNVKSSLHSIDLIKHKSSSIPQMKMEQLKYSLKEKAKSKDAIEEVNRMFATVRRSELSDLEEHNRPMIRNGPRDLPVVKTKTYNDSNKKESDIEGTSDLKKKSVAKCCHENDDVNTETVICKCCQTNNMQLSAGDSFFKHECCYHKMLCEGRCEKCLYMLCCHYQKQTNKVETGSLICECCKSEKLDVGCGESNPWI